MRGQLPEPSDTEPFLESIDDLEADVELVEADGKQAVAGHDMPAWRKIEVYRELRELNHLLEDDVYGYQPIRKLWDKDRH